jgi:ABC-type dipeptide/oligopeptide/nickel transport system permease component
MIKLLLRKCLQGLMMILIVSAVTFALLGFAGGDALTQLRDNPQIS